MCFRIPAPESPYIIFATKDPPYPMLPRTQDPPQQRSPAPTIPLYPRSPSPKDPHPRIPCSKVPHSIPRAPSALILPLPYSYPATLSTVGILLSKLFFYRSRNTLIAAEVPLSYRKNLNTERGSNCERVLNCERV